MSGITSKLEIDDDAEGVEVTVAESSRKALTEVLGAERRDRILSALYLARQDAVHIVRQSSIQIWKVLVHNTPRTGMLFQFYQGIRGCNVRVVREILPELVSQLMSLLSSEEAEQQEVRQYAYLRITANNTPKTGARTTGELCKKFGERILGEIVKNLRTKSSSPDAQTREAICLLLSELMSAYSHPQPLFFA